MSAYRTFNMQRDKDKHRSTTCLLPTIGFGTGDHTCPITQYYPQQNSVLPAVQIFWLNKYGPLKNGSIKNILQ